MWFARIAILVVVAGCGGTRATSSTVSNDGEAPAGQPEPDRTGEAVEVSRTTGDGVIELEGDRSLAMEDAERKMAAHCGPDKFHIVQVGEEAVGEARAWRVHYVCDGP